MLKFKNLNWLFNKNTTVASLLMALVISFAFYMNYESVAARLAGNNQLVSSYIEAQFNQYKTRLELVRQLLKLHRLEDLTLTRFTSVYYLDAFGTVVDRNTQDKNDQINKFIEINQDSLQKGVYTSELMYTKSLSPSVYMATVLDADGIKAAKEKDGVDAKYVCVRIDIGRFLDGVVTLGTGYIITDSHENIVYSSKPQIVPPNEHLGNSNDSWLLEGLLDNSNALFADVKELKAGFYVRSFISKDEFFNSTFVVAMVLLAIFFLFCYNIYLDKKILKIGIIDQLNYCLTLFNARNLSDCQYVKTLATNDILELQKQTARSLIDYKEISDEYNELEQRLSSMFSKSSIPMLMIDAFTAKIFKANQSALEFYNQKTVSITKMNLYMLSGKDTKTNNDPVVLAGNIQNCIKNQGNYIQAHHFVGGVHKEVKIYPFVMRSERFCYDTLMILDTNLLSKNFEYLNMRAKALENSFICYLNLSLEGNKLVITSSSRGLQRFLGNVLLTGRLLKDLCHEADINKLAMLMQKVRNLKQSGNIQQFKTFETTLFFKQNDGNFSQFKVNFIVAYAKGLQIVLTAHLAHIRSDLSFFEVQTTIDYRSIYQNARELIAILDEKFNFLSINSALRELIGHKENLRQVISKRTLTALNSIKVGSQVELCVELLDNNQNVHVCKFKYLSSKSARGETVYCVYFQEDFYYPLLEEFAIFLKDQNIDMQDLMAEFYRKKQINPLIAQSGLMALGKNEGLDRLKEVLANYLKGNNQIY